MKNNDEPFCHFSAAEICAKLGVDPKEGLDDAKATRRLKQYGPNALKAKRSSGAFRLLLSQFNSPLIYMLLFAAGLSLLLRDKTDALIILAIVLVSGLLGFFQERSALQAMAKLLKMVQVKADVIRNGKQKEISITKVVPGDIVVLNAGDVIPGDCYLLETKDLFVDEATLTGETFYSEKNLGVLPGDTSLAKRSNSLFMGTHVVSGTGRAVVVTTGKNTEFGKISQRLAQTRPETEFEHGIRHFGYFLMEVTFVLLIVIFAFNVYLHRSVVESLLFSLSLAVGLTPQLLPAIISINLAHGARQMAKKQVIVKRLASIENFGSMSILCSDKTGTLTSGAIELNAANGTEGEKSDKVLLYACLNATFQSGYTNPIDHALAQNTSVNLKDWRKLDEVPYDFVRKRLSVLVEKDATPLMISKGAFNQILSVCTQAETDSGVVVDIATVSKDLHQKYEEYSNNGFRVLGLAYRKGEGISILNPGHEKQMIFLGFLLFSDPLKEGIKETIDNLHSLGISLKIITGDNKLVAMHVAKLLGLSEEVVLTGSDLNGMSDPALAKQALQKSIFAEIEPNQKERIILALRRAGHVVGYMGDGINDVTALHAADVSISVESAADAAKEVADIVLMEKGLSVLEAGVKAGRMTFANTLKYVFMATSANFGNMFSMAGASLFLSFLPLLPKQVLLTNLMTDFPEMAIATDHVDEAMVSKPLRWDIHFIRKFMMLFGLISSVFDFATFGVLLLLNASVIEFRTGWFVESIVSATLIVLVIRTFNPFYTSRPSKYLLGMVVLVVVSTVLLVFSPLAPYLGLTPLPWKFYPILALIVVLYVFFVEIAKKVFLQRWIVGDQVTRPISVPRILRIEN